MNTKKKGIILISINSALIIIVIILLFFTPIVGPFNFIVRLAALLGFTCMFLATVMTPFMVELYKIFGRPFIKQHHLYSILGLVLITVHPVAYAISVLDITIFMPVLYPWIEFWNLAGRPALILIYIAVIAAIFRKKMPNKWKWLHVLNYIALFFGYVHGVLIGSDFQNPAIFSIFTLMIIISLSTFIFKRYQNYQRKQKKNKT